MKNLYVKPQLVKMEVAMEGTILTGSLPIVPNTTVNDPIQIQSKRVGVPVMNDLGNIKMQSMSHTIEMLAQ